MNEVLCHEWCLLCHKSGRKDCKQLASLLFQQYFQKFTDANFLATIATFGGSKHFLLFSLLRTIVIIWATVNFPSANVFNLDHCEILLFDKGLKKTQTILLTHSLIHHFETVQKFKEVADDK